MGQIVKKKKGRPSKADLAARTAAESNNRRQNHRRPEEEQRDVRWSLRRRSGVRYNLIDYDEDYLEDEEDFELDDEEGGERREKKLQFVLKLPNSNSGGRATSSNNGGDSVAPAWRAGGGESEQDGDEEEQEDGEDEEESPVVKKRKISGDGNEDDYGDNDDEEEREGKGESNMRDSVRGSPNNAPSRTPMPEKKLLELILHKLQKKDTYGVYAEPVDPEELPDYHDIIKHPMDFATIRKKLAGGSYSTLEEFESDVSLICSNAMQYNAPDTIYHKQAHAIEEIAQKKFQRLRFAIERRSGNEQFEKEPKSEQKTKLNPIVKKQMKKPLGRSIQDPINSNFSSGATLTERDAHNTSCGVQASNFERPSTYEGLAEGISSIAEGNVEKLEEFQSGKGIAPKFGRKPLVVDDNRRGTYEISNQLVDKSESIFSTFEGEDKQLIPVGLYGEHSYAQSVARFAATLGPIAWSIASKRIERALPPESKFGRGWVLEYEPLPTPVLFVASQPQKGYSSTRKPWPPAVSVKFDKPIQALVSLSEQDVGRPTSKGRPATSSGTVAEQQNPCVRRLQNAAVSIKGDKAPDCLVPANDSGENRAILDAKPPRLPILGGKIPASSTRAVDQQNPSVTRLQNASVPGKNETSPSLFCTGGHLDSISESKSSILPNCRGSTPTTPSVAVKPLNPFSRNDLRPENMVKNRMEANCPTLTNQNTNLFVQKQSLGGAQMPTSWQIDMIARNKNFLLPSPCRQPLPANEGGVSGQEQGLNDPVHVMRHFVENSQQQHNKTNSSLGLSHVRPFANQSPREGNTSEPKTAPTSAWMSGDAGIGNAPVENPNVNSNPFSAESYNTTRELYPQVSEYGECPVLGTTHFNPERSKVPFRGLASNRVNDSNEVQVQNRPTVFPELLLTDLPSVPLQSPWQGFRPHSNKQKQKQDTLPPDLNVAFQSTVDPQHPDLALQL